jgi:hypothetical protein
MFREAVREAQVRFDKKVLFCDGLKEIKADYSIAAGTRIDTVSCRRIAILVSTLFVKVFFDELAKNGKAQLSFVLLEPEIFRIAKEKKLTCDPLEAELSPRADKEFILKLWGVDKKTGFNTKISNLENWLEILWEAEHGRTVIVGTGRTEDARIEKTGIGPDEIKGAEICPGL